MEQCAKSKVVAGPDAPVDIKLAVMKDQAKEQHRLTWKASDLQEHLLFRKLQRAAKAKGKLRLRVHVLDAQAQDKDPQEHLEPDDQARDSEPDSKQHIGAYIMAPLLLSAEDNVKKMRLLGAALAAQEQYPNAAASIYCDECNAGIAGDHWHCGSCGNGDYDLCNSCVEQGQTCLDRQHWLIKRSISSGTVDAKSFSLLMPAKKSPSASSLALRTCNACTKGIFFTYFHSLMSAFAQNQMITCQDCRDYDLCIGCHVTSDHGHHPGHSYAAIGETSELSSRARDLLAGPRHNAACDQCSKVAGSWEGTHTESQIIRGVRHKCLDCPDFDLCNECKPEATIRHKGHSFVPIYQPITTQDLNLPRHHYIRCDGPLCRDEKDHIRGIRYKCSVCPDFDLCQRCEAHPELKHDSFHPLLKIKAPVSCFKLADVAKNFLSNYNFCTHEEAFGRDERPTPSTDADLQATFVSESTPDGSIKEPGKEFVQSWSLRNSGTRPWPKGVILHCTGGDAGKAEDCAISTVYPATDSEVAQGAIWQFKIGLTTPERHGRYVSYWRLKTVEGVQFGDRIWCDIMVQDVKSVKDVANPKPDESELQLSQMVFPKLSMDQIAKEDVGRAMLDDLQSLNLEDGLTDDEFELLETSTDTFSATNGSASV